MESYRHSKNFAIEESVDLGTRFSSVAVWKKRKMQLHDYQIEARNFLLNRLYTHSGAGLWLDCGLGKTAVTLHTIHTMLAFGEISNATIVAPARVIATSWPKEIKEWGLPLSWAWIRGGDEERQAAYESRPDIYFIGSENLALKTLSEETQAKRQRSQLAEWLEKRKFRTDLLVVDESTKFKSWSASRSKMLRRLVRRIPLRITLTGTPVPNSLGDIFSQQFILDAGKTLSPHIGKFRDRFMQRCGYENRQWEMRPEMVETLKQIIAPWYLHQSAMDHLDLPDLVHNEIEVILPPKVLGTYKRFEKELFVEIDGRGIGAMGGSGKYGLCRQIASGNAYDENGDAVGVHNAKLDALEGLYEELNGKPLLVAYWFDHEYERILKRFPHAEVIRGGTSASKTVRIIENWQAGKTKIVVVQASAASHGVDGLQKGGNDLCWFTLTDQPETRHQLEKRIFRQGVKGNQVRIHYLLAKSTIDSAIKRALDRKDATERDVLGAIKEMRVAA